jgi:hypothetical protein
MDLSIAQPTTPAFEPSSSDARPPLWRAFLLRFSFCYWLQFCVIDVWGSEIGTFHWIGQIARAPADAVIVWFGQSVLGIPAALTRAENGSGDKTADWLALLVFALVSLVAAAAWCAIDRRRARDARLRAFLRVVIRYTLAKVFFGQFPEPNGNRLMQRYGDSSPMGLMWTFMGASPAYVFFSGAAETIGGLLVLFRRTTVLGALVLAAVLTNIVLMNFCYDVCVKLNSSHYLAMCILLLLPDLGRLARLLVLQRPTQLVADRLVLPRRWMRIARVVVKLGAIALVLATNVKQDIASHQPKADQPWTEGYWNVVRFVRDGVEQPPLVNDAKRWSRIRFQTYKDKHWARWRFMNDSYAGLCNYQIDEAAHTMVFTPDKEDWDKDAIPVSGPVTMTYTRGDADHLTLDGKIDGAVLRVELQRFDGSKMLLVSRGFRWINEEPFNR